jgi:hypothetical protein
MMHADLMPRVVKAIIDLGNMKLAWIVRVVRANLKTGCAGIGLKARSERIILVLGLGSNL